MLIYSLYRMNIDSINAKLIVYGILKGKLLEKHLIMRFSV